MTNLAIALSLIVLVEGANGNPHAIGDRRLGSQQAWGIYQIRPIMVKDMNRLGIPFRRKDCFDPVKSERAASRWLVKTCGKDAPVEVYVRSWAGGQQHRRGSVAEAQWLAATEDYWRKAKHYWEKQHEKKSRVR